jgi:hypothetical protein
MCVGENSMLKKAEKMKVLLIEYPKGEDSIGDFDVNWNKIIKRILE